MTSCQKRYFLAPARWEVHVHYLHYTPRCVQKGTAWVKIGLVFQSVSSNSIKSIRYY